MSDVANQLRRSSNASRGSNGLDDLPQEYLSDKFRLPPSFFKINSHEQVAQKTEELNKQLEKVESRLVHSVANHFDRFMKAFETFDNVKEDLEQISLQTKLSKDCITDLKEE